MPKPSGLMDEQERAICSRLHACRKGKRWPQRALAEALDISLNQLASIEYGRTPLRFLVGSKFCFIMSISQRWLVEGEPPENYHISVGQKLRERIPANLLYSKAYWRFLKPFLD